MSEPLAALLGLEQQLRQASSLAQLSFTIVNQTQRCVPCMQAVLLLGKTTGELRVFAASDISSVDHTSPYTLWIERLARAQAGNGSGNTATMLQARDVDAALQAEWSEMAPTCLLWQPLPVEARGANRLAYCCCFAIAPGAKPSLACAPISLRAWAMRCLPCVAITRYAIFGIYYTSGASACLRLWRRCWSWFFRFA